MEVALYTRVSTRDKDQDPEVQLVKLREFAVRHGWEICKGYTDFATGRDGNRPGLKRLLQDARTGKFETVVIVRIDRIMRSLSNLYQMYQDLEAWDVRLVATDQDLDTRTTAGRLMFGLLGLLAQWEVEQTSDRVKDGLRKARKASKRIGRPQTRLDVEKAQALLAEGIPKTQVAEMLGVPRSTLNRHLATIESNMKQRPRPKWRGRSVYKQMGEKWADRKQVFRSRVGWWIQLVVPVVLS